MRASECPLPPWRTGQAIVDTLRSTIRKLVRPIRIAVLMLLRRNVRFGKPAEDGAFGRLARCFARLRLAVRVPNHVTVRTHFMAPDRRRNLLFAAVRNALFPIWLRTFGFLARPLVLISFRYGAGGNSGAYGVSALGMRVWRFRRGVDYGVKVVD